MKKSTLKFLFELKSLVNFLKRNNTPEILSYLKKNEKLVSWTDSLQEADTPYVFEDFFKKLLQKDLTGRIFFALINDKIILNLTCLENVNDENIDKNFISLLKENIDQSL